MRHGPGEDPAISYPGQ